jgi:hypothetical protein
LSSDLGPSCVATYWTVKQTLEKSLVQFGLVDHQTPKSKVNGPTVHFPCNLSFLVIDGNTTKASK